MSMHKRLQESMRQGVILERDRCMRICTGIIEWVKTGVDNKLMTATQKHLAMVKFDLAQGLVGAIQLKIMSGEDPDAKAEATDLHGRDPDALGSEQGGPDGPSAG